MKLLSPLGLILVLAAGQATIYGQEVLSRGPIHEAFAQPLQAQPQPSPPVPKAPPEPIPEVPPEQRPEGDNVQWLAGYWAWDAERNDFVPLGLDNRLEGYHGAPANRPARLRPPRAWRGGDPHS